MNFIIIIDIKFNAIDNLIELSEYADTPMSDN